MPEKFVDNGNFFATWSPKNVRTWWFLILLANAALCVIPILVIRFCVRLLSLDLPDAYNIWVSRKGFAAMLFWLSAVASFLFPLATTFPPSNIYAFHLIKKKNNVGVVKANTLTSRQLSYLQKNSNSPCYQYDPHKSHIHNYNVYLKSLMGRSVFLFLSVSCSLLLFASAFTATIAIDSFEEKVRDEKGNYHRRNIDFSQWHNKHKWLTPTLFKSFLILIIILSLFLLICGMYSVYMFFQLKPYVAERTFPCKNLVQFTDLDILRKNFTNSE